MAFLPTHKTDSKEQTAAVCQLCEIEPKLKWKCQECNLLMCQRCKDKVHPKFPSASNHNVIDIKDIGKDVDESPAAELIFTNLRCQIHKSQNCCLFCKTCHQIVCPTCFAKSHKAHNLTEIEDGYKNILAKLKNVDKTIDQQFVNVTINQEKLNEAKFVEQINNVRATKEIESQEEALLKAVKLYKDKLLTDLRQNSNSLFLSFEEKSKHMKETRERLMEQKLKVNKVIQSKDLLEVFGKSRDVVNITPPKVEVTYKFNCLPTFISGKTENISEVFGSVQKVKIKPLKIEVKRLFQFDMDSKYDIDDETNTQMVLSYGTLWVSNQVTITNLKLEKNSVNTAFEVETRSNSIAVNSSDDILLADGSSKLKLLCKENKQILPTGFHVSQMKITAVHVSYNKDVMIAGFLDQATKIVVMNQTAEAKKEYQFDTNKKLLFTLVICITSNHRNNIGIVDTTHEGRIGCILVIGQDNNTFNIYTGHSALKSQGIEFKPHDIVTTALDNFVVLDEQLLHILNNEGQAITFVHIDQLIPRWPEAICASDTSHLYIACNDPEESDKYNTDEYDEHYKMSVYSVDISNW